ncbi:TPA: hypothetical protein ACH3X1_015734 [Trebouxia sp. C0004]
MRKRRWQTSEQGRAGHPCQARYKLLAKGWRSQQSKSLGICRVIFLHRLCNVLACGTSVFDGNGHSSKCAGLSANTGWPHRHLIAHSIQPKASAEAEPLLLVHL